MSTIVTILASGLSGKLADTIYARNSHGPYTRPFVVPTDPATARQLRARNRLRDVVAAWGDTLTPAQRASWSDYATRVTTPGRPVGRRHLNGHQMYLRCNAGRSRGFMGIVADAPRGGTLGTVNTLPMNRFPGAGLIFVGVDTAESWTSEDGAWLIAYTSAGQSAGTTFYAGPWRFLGAIPGNSVTPAVSTTFGDPFGPAVAGPNSFGRIRLARADGRLTEPYILPFQTTL